MALRRPRWPLALLVALATGVGVPAATAVPAAAAGGDDAVVSVNTVDGSTKFKVRLSIRRENGDVVTTSNAAVAVASCQDCEAVAISFQVLLISDDADVVTPTNLAIAMNVGCDSCDTLASAYQYVLSNDGHVRFSKDGQEALREIRKKLKQLRHDDLSIDEIQSQLDDLSAQLLVVLTHDIVVASSDGKQVDTTRPFADALGEDGQPLVDDPTVTSTTTSQPDVATTQEPTTTTT